MSLSFKKVAILGFVVSMGLTSALGQNATEFKHKVYVQLKTSLAIPSAFGDNFLARAYDLDPGFLGEARVFLPNRFYLGIQGNFFKTEVTDTGLAGNFDRSNVWHNYVIGGYPLFLRDSKWGMDAGIGLGYSLYVNRMGDAVFYDSGFSTMANLHANYRFSQIVGVDVGIQYAWDFLRIDTAPQLKSFFRNTNILYLSAGLVFYINQ